MKFDANNASLMNIKYQTNNIKKQKTKQKQKHKGLKRKFFLFWQNTKCEFSG